MSSNPWHKRPDVSIPPIQTEMNPTESSVKKIDTNPEIQLMSSESVVQLESSMSELRIQEIQGIKGVREYPVVSLVTRTEMEGSKTKVNEGFPVETNFYQVKFDSKMKGYRYDVKFEPEIKSKLRVKAFFHEVKEKHPYLKNVRCAFDGVCNLFCAERLKDKLVQIVHKLTLAQFERLLGSDPKRLKVYSDADEGKDVTITIQETQDCEISMAPLKEYFAVDHTRENVQPPRIQLNMLDIIFREFFSNPDEFIAMGNGFFSKFEEEHDIGGGACIWRGNFASVQPAEIGLCLKFDSTSMVMWKDIAVADYLKIMMGPQWMKAPRERIEAIVRKLKIEVTHRPCAQVFTVESISVKPASAEIINFTDPVTKKERQVDVVAYFKDQYKVKLHNPQLPCLEVGKDKKKLPIEVCRIARATNYGRPLTGDQQMACVDGTRMMPSERFQKTELADVLKKFGGSKIFKAFKLEIVPKRITAPARILPAPTIVYGNGKVQVRPGAGEWGKDSIGRTFVDPVPNATKVVCINFADTEIQHDAAVAFFTQQLKVCRERGMKLACDSKSMHTFPSKNGLVAQLDFVKSFATSSVSVRPNIILIIVPRLKVNPLYPSIKKMCESSFGGIGQVTNCFNAGKVQKANFTYFGNCSLKICCKLGGTCHTLLPEKLKNNTTLIIGADVYHSPPGSMAPSVAAVVGSYDASFSKYMTTISYQKGRCEQILQIQDCAYNLIKNFMAKNNKQPPYQILYYRDGVGESFFSETISFEVGAIRAAALQVHPDYKPRISYVNVQKRHHAVFFPARGNADKNGNPLAGTIIDSVIVDPRAVDFYLYAHACIIGTARPAHHHLLLNEIKLSMADVQTFTNKMSYLYQRCPRSVSIPAPVYYAHHAAYRAKLYLDEDNASMKSGKSADKSSMVPYLIPNAPKIHSNLHTALFYM